jgi:hypothetical protein
MTATPAPLPSTARCASDTARRAADEHSSLSVESLSAEVVAAVISVVDDEPMVRVIDTGTAPRLPAAVFQPSRFACLDTCVRATVLRDAGLALGHVEQLQSTIALDETGSPMLSIGYLALAHRAEPDGERASMHNPVEGAGWQSWYTYFPWEDWRRGRPRILRDEILPRLDQWAREEDFADVDPSETPRRHRLHMCFGDNEQMWDEEKVVERFDMLSDAGLVSTLSRSNAPMLSDHRRCLAVAMSRLRSRIKSRPLVFDLMPARFTLFELQRAVEAILGPHLHKQNFRRLVEHMGLVEPTDEMKSHTGGRPAKLYRFRQKCLLEHQQPGLRVRSARN